MLCLDTLLLALFHCLDRSLYYSISLWITWTQHDLVKAVLASKSFKLLRGKLCTVVWHHSFWNSIQAIWYYAMVRFRTIDLKSHPIAQFEENCIIRKKMLNSSKNSNKHKIPMRAYFPANYQVKCRKILFCRGFRMLVSNGFYGCIHFGLDRTTGCWISGKLTYPISNACCLPRIMWPLLSATSNETLHICLPWF